jgi:predicted RNA methylase
MSLAIPHLDKYFPIVPNNILNNLKYDEEGIYSITPPNSARIISDNIARYFKTNDGSEPKLVITDATAGLGGNVFSFASFFSNVFAIEKNLERYMMLVNNVSTLKYNNVNCMLGNFVPIVQNMFQDVIFMDPPWGGKDYKSAKKMVIELDGVDFAQICSDIYDNSICSLLVIKLPLNYNLDTFPNHIKEKWTIDVMKKIQVIYIPCSEQSSS